MNGGSAILTLSFSTVSGNGVIFSLHGSGGGGIYVSGGTLNLNNTIVAGNTTSLGPNPSDISGTVVSQGHNLVGNTGGVSGLVGSDLQNVNPLLAGSLADNGGPTKTLALLAGSPAIDAANDSSCVASDQRGVARPQGPHCDIGAYEALTITGNTGVGGAVLNYLGGSTTADSAGNYVIVVPLGWDNTITPSKAGYIFSPTSRTFSGVLMSYVSQNFTAKVVIFLPLISR